MTIKAPESLSASTIFGLMKHDGSVEQVTLIEDGYTSSNGGDFWALLPDTEGGDAWDSGTNPEDVFNATTFGVRSPASASGKCWGIILHIAGENLVRPNAAQACVDPTTFISRVMIY